MEFHTIEFVPSLYKPSVVFSPLCNAIDLSLVMQTALRRYLSTFGYELLNNIHTNLILQPVRALL